MPNKVKITNSDLKRYTKNGSSADTVKFITGQKIGKFELILRHDPTEDLPTLRMNKNFGGIKKIKWIIDFDNKKFVKLVNNVVDHSENSNIGELIIDLIDLIQKYDFEEIFLYQRRNITYEQTTKLKIESIIRETIYKLRYK